MIIKLSRYGAVINDKETGAIIYNDIRTALDKNKSVEIDFSDVITMATFCAKQTFGRLYLELGQGPFFERLLMMKASSDLKFIVRTGIESALSDAGQG